LEDVVALELKRTATQVKMEGVEEGQYAVV
jgi:hypothetical protein